MRITRGSIHQTITDGLQRTLRSVAEVQEQLASGKRINRLSDAPTDATRAFRFRNEVGQLDSFESAADDGEAILNTQDRALQTAVNLIGRARELALSARNTLVSPEAREGIAREIEGLRAQMVDVANTTYQDRAVFAGFENRAAQVEPSGAVTWLGDSGAVNRQVADEVTVRVNIDARTAFGVTGGTDVFEVLQTLAEDTRNANLGGIDSGLDGLQARFADMTGALGEVGARTNQIDAARTDGAQRRETVRASLSIVEDTDVALAALDLARAQSGYQAALSAAARSSMPSLVDFLR